MKHVLHFFINNWDVIATAVGAIFVRSTEKPKIEKRAAKKALNYINTGELEEEQKTRFWEVYKQNKK